MRKRRIGEGLRPLPPQPKVEPKLETPTRSSPSDSERVVWTLSSAEVIDVSIHHESGSYGFVRAQFDPEPDEQEIHATITINYSQAFVDWYHSQLEAGNDSRPLWIRFRQPQIVFNRMTWNIANMTVESMERNTLLGRAPPVYTRIILEVEHVPLTVRSIPPAPPPPQATRR